METIAVFYDGSVYTRRWLWALIWAKREIAELGFKFDFVGFQHSLPKQAQQYLEKGKYKIILIAHHDGIRTLSSEKRIEFLKMVHKYCQELVWLDTSDSTGTCNFEVLPYVDLYLKKQLLKNLGDYKKTLWGARIHSNYFHTVLDVKDSDIVKETMQPLEMIYADKIGISWNVGLGNIESHGIINNIYNRILFPHIPIRENVYTYHSPNTMKTIDVEFQGAFTSLGVGWQRRRAYELLNRMTGVSFSPMNKRGSFEEYKKELRTAKCTLGLFSYGEICYRDFEAFISGTCLIKPDMDHLVTYPNWYIKGESYIPVKWDLSDFEQTINDIVGNKIDYVKIANNAQSLYSYYLSKEGRVNFAKHLYTIFKLGELKNV